MSNVSAFYTQTSLALVAYGNFSAGIGPNVQELRRIGMAEAQATQFANSWTVVDQYSDITGLSATVFQDQSGKRFLAIRGTDPSLLDLTAGVILANGFPPQLNPQFQLLRAKIQEWTNSGVLPTSFTVTGHSLGGYLASAVALEFGARIEATFTYNAPGVDAGLGGVVDLLRTTLGISSSGALTNLYNLRATSGFSLIANLGRQLTSPILIETEFSLNPFENHSIVPLTNSLAIYDLFAKLDPALNTTDPAVGIGKITDILKAASRNPALSLEATLDSISKLFKDPAAPDPAPTASDNREQYYQNLIGLQDRVALYAGTLTLDSLVTTSDVQLAGLAQGSEAIAYRYALKELNPFAIVGSNALYAPHNANGELNLYSPTAGAGLTEAYLADRAEMLGWKNVYYQKDGNVALRGDRTESYQFTDKSIKDDRTGQDLALTVVGRNSLLINNPAKIIFGSDADENLIGSTVAAGDHLYGGGGADTLQGNQGNDYLEGGSGNDTYVWNIGDGFDTILDTDGIGRLLVNGRIVSGGIRVAQNDYVSTDKQTLHFEGDPITGGVLIVNGDLRIENFTSGELGIVLNDQGSVAEIQPTATSFDLPFSNGALFFGTEGDDHVVSRSSVFVGKSGNDLLEAAAGGGGIFSGGAGDDLLIGGVLTVIETVTTGGDFSEALGGIEPIIETEVPVIVPEFHSGGAGADIILGGDGEDWISGEFREFSVSAFQFLGSSFRYDENAADPLASSGFYVDPFSGNAREPPLTTTIDSDYPDLFPGDLVAALRYVLGVSGTGPSPAYYDDFIDAGAGNDDVTGGYGSDIIYGGAGDDILEGDKFNLLSGFGHFRDEEWRKEVIGLFGVPGDDFLDGEDGNDRLTDIEGGNETFLGGGGNDTIQNFDPSSDVAFSNYLSGGEGDDSLSSSNLSPGGFDTLFGGPGNDRLTSGTGNVYLDGGPDSDFYFMSANVASAIVSDFDETVGNFDQLKIFLSTGPVDLISDLSISRDESNLYLGHGGISDRITIENWFADDAYQIEQIATEQTIIVGGGGEGGALPIITHISHTFDVAAIESKFSSPTAAADFLWGSSAAEQLAGGLGDDFVFGGAGTDILAGNEGSDTLNGGEDSDVFVFNVGDGVDHILDTGSSGTDSVAFGPGITLEMLTLGLGSLLINVGENGDAIHIEGFNPNNARDSSSVELFQFADGAQLTYGELIARGFDFVGTVADDVSHGTSVNDRFSGRAGSDTYFFGRGSGQDVIEDLDANGLDTDTVRVGAEVTPSDMSVTRSGDFITLAVRDTQDRLAIRWQPEQGYGIERVEFSGGTVWDAAMLEGMAASSTNTAPTVANPLMDQAAQKDVPFGFQLPEDAFRDMDQGEILDYSAALANGNPLPAWLTFDATSRQFTGTPATGDVGAISIRITAADLAGTSATDDFQLVVSDGGKCHEVNLVGMDHCDDRGDVHGKRDDERRRKPDGRKHDDRDDDRSVHKGDRMADCIAAYVESKPRYNFEALALELEHADRNGEALNVHEIARRWRAVGQYASALENGQDEDARGGADYRFNDHGLLGGGAFGGGFGYSGSIGALRRVANLQTLQGLEEGLQRLHA